MVDINKLKQIQDIDDSLKNRRHIEALRQNFLGSSVIDQIKQTSLISKTFDGLVGPSLREVLIAKSAHGTIFGSSALQMEAIKSSIMEIAKTTSSASLQSIFNSQFSNVFEGLHKVQSDAMQATIQNLKHQLSLKLPSSFIDFRDLGVATNLSLMKAMAEIANSQTSSASQSIINSFSGIALDHSRFMNNTLMSLGASLDSQITNALRGSLLLANEQTILSSSLIQQFSEKQITKTEHALPYIRTNIFRVQKKELLKRNDLEEDETYESLIIKSSSATIFELVVTCMNLIGLCNEASETTSGEPIFKQTSSFLISFSDLLRIVANNRNNLTLVVECLYLILYEGAGNDKLRYIEDNHVSLDEAEVIMKIKHLRNKWLSHDADHGKNAKKDFELRKEALKWFGFDYHPIKKDEHILLESFILKKVEEFLKLLLERVSKFST